MCVRVWGGGTHGRSEEQARRFVRRATWGCSPAWARPQAWKLKSRDVLARSEWRRRKLTKRVRCRAPVSACV